MSSKPFALITKYLACTKLSVLNGRSTSGTHEGSGGPDINRHNQLFQKLHVVQIGISRKDFQVTLRYVSQTCTQAELSG